MDDLGLLKLVVPVDKISTSLSSTDTLVLTGLSTDFPVATKVVLCLSIDTPMVTAAVLGLFTDISVLTEAVLCLSIDIPVVKGAVFDKYLASAMIILGTTDGKKTSK